MAKQTGHFGWQGLRAALDSSPLVGRGRVEDTWNLLGRALRTVVTCAATTLKIPREQVRAGAGVTLLGAPSLKAALDLDWGDPAAQADALARLVAEVDRVVAIPLGATTVHCPAVVCHPCSQRAACTTARGGRSIGIHAQEALLPTLGAHQQHPDCRARLRERITVEHSLARVDQIQGPKARYKGVRKNTLDLRRTAVIAKLQRLARLPKAA